MNINYVHFFFSVKFTYGFMLQRQQRIFFEFKTKIKL